MPGQTGRIGSRWPELPPPVRLPAQPRSTGVKSMVSIERYPYLLADKAYRSYPLGRPEIETISPDHLRPPI